MQEQCRRVQLDDVGVMSNESRDMSWWPGRTMYDGFGMSQVAINVLDRRLPEPLGELCWSTSWRQAASLNETGPEM